MVSKWGIADARHGCLSRAAAMALVLLRSLRMPGTGFPRSGRPDLRTTSCSLSLRFLTPATGAPRAGSDDCESFFFALARCFGGGGQEPFACRSPPQLTGYPQYTHFLFITSSFLGTDGNSRYLETTTILSHSILYVK